MIASFAQNAEDVRLWRVLSGRHDGFYLDVGAGHPAVDSVTKLFYDAGWCGINIEPGPHFSALVDDRPRDINLEIAIAEEKGERDLWVTHPDPGLTSLEQPDASLLPNGFVATRTRVRTTTLADVIASNAHDRHVDFMKIDAEGAEAAVLASFDLTKVRPSVVLVEAIAPLNNRPTHDHWEPLLLENNYICAAFDGINRFYVPVEAEDLVPALAYPITQLDRYETHATATSRIELAKTVAERERLKADAAARSERDPGGFEALDLVRAMESTVSWRVTRPLRAVRRLSRGARTPAGARAEGSSAGIDDLERAFSGRLEQVRALLTGEQVADPDVTSVEASLTRLASSLDATFYAESVAAWLCLVAADGAYPDEDVVDGATRLLRGSGSSALVDETHGRFRRAVKTASASSSQLDLVANAVVVDATRTLTTDVHTGIQRVVRETLSRWIVTEPRVRLVVWNDALGCLTLVSDDEVDRLQRWRETMYESGSPIVERMAAHESGNAVVPIDCHIVVPELPHPRRSSGVRGVVEAGIHSGLSIIGFDLIPVVAAEKVPPGFAGEFCEFLSILKRADRVSAISAGTADSFRHFVEMLELEGTKGPEVRAHPLPTEVPVLDKRLISAARQALALGDAPVVLVVGSHEPRKNHVALLEAADRLWSSGLDFELLMLGGSAWRAEVFEQYAARLLAAGRPINIRRRVTEDELWAAYRIARFSVFPSLIEGFGLPVAESLASGTPVITSRHGSMAEIGADGGALLVDPRDVDALEEQMRTLLTDDELLERLRREARARDFGSWDDYARDVWDFLVREEL